jgi:membrane fusion protein (multidrug efflux system)
MKSISISLIMLIAATLLVRADDDDKPETEVAVKVVKVVKTTLARAVTAYGAVEPEPTAFARLSPALPGIIAEIDGVEGQSVMKGDVLFRLDSRAVDAALKKAELGISFAQATVDRQRKLIAAEGTSEKLVLEAEQALAAAKTEFAAAKVQQSLLRGEAPMDGTLVSFQARPGEAADATRTLAEIIDLDRLVAALSVPRAEAAAVKEGQIVKLAIGDEVLEGRIVFLSPQADAATDTVLARASIPKGRGVRPGAFVGARIVVEEHADRLAVPFASVYTDPEGKSTLSIVEGDIATQKVVKTGLRDGDFIEVEGEGLREGVIVVTIGSYALPEVTRIRVLNSREEGR